MKKENILEQIESKKAKFILIISFFLPLIVLFGYVFYNVITDKRTGKQIYLDNVKPYYCIGIVDSIYRQKMNHNIQTLKIKDGTLELPSSWEEKFSIGDSISKKKGDLILEHYRNGKLIEILDYNNIFIRD